jgi:hypothetical protein
MKKIIRITENDLVKIVKRVIKENEEEWIDSSTDMSDSDFSKMKIEKKIVDQTKMAVKHLDDEYKEILIDFLEKNDVNDLQRLVKKELEGGPPSIKESKDSNYKVRRVISLLLKTVAVATAISTLPASILISSTVAATLGYSAIGVGVLGRLISPKK